MAPARLGPSQYLAWIELACLNRLGRVYQAVPPNGIIAPYPRVWREDRAVLLATTFETIRQAVGGPIRVTSGYRTPAYNQAIGGARHSQHTAGRALDLQHPQYAPARFHDLILELHRARLLPHLGGLGRYPSFVHIDVRPTTGTLARW